MAISRLRWLAILFFALAIGGCSRLAAFDTIVPKDRSADLVGRGLAYGPDGRQRLDVYRPEMAGKAAVVVFIYGGSWNSGRRQDYGFVARALASRGFVTVVPDYRLLPEHPYPDFVQDSARATAWAYRNAATYGGDPERLFLVGHSAGAYNVMMVTLAPEFLRREGLSPAIIDAAIGISGPYDFLPLDVAETQAAFGNVRGLRETQPVNHATGRKSPILLATGLDDEFVEPRNTRALAAALRRSGNSVETREYEGIGHAGALTAIARPFRGRAPVLDDIVQFLDAH